jgi:hypothetical protein
MTEPLNSDDVGALYAMAARPLGYAFTVTLLAQLCGINGKAGVTRFRINILGHLIKCGLVKRVRARPAMYVITAAGSAALADQEGRP